MTSSSSVSLARVGGSLLSTAARGVMSIVNLLLTPLTVLSVLFNNGESQVVGQCRKRPAAAETETNLSYGKKYCHSCGMTNDGNSAMFRNGNE